MKRSLSVKILISLPSTWIFVKCSLFRSQCLNSGFNIKKLEMILNELKSTSLQKNVQPVTPAAGELQPSQCSLSVTVLGSSGEKHAPPLLSQQGAPQPAFSCFFRRLEKKAESRVFVSVTFQVREGLKTAPKCNPLGSDHLTATRTRNVSQLALPRPP